MPATPSATLLENSGCFTCLGMSMADALRLGLWSSISENMACRGALENMTTVGAVTVFNYAGDSILNFSSFTAITGRLMWTDSPGITEMNFPVLASYGGSTLNLSNNTIMDTLTMPGVVFTNTGIGISITGCALSAASIEGVLRRGVVSGLTTATLNFSGGTSANLASLSAAGQADAATLTTSGCTLIFNP